MVGYAFWLIKVKGAIVSVAIRVADRHIVVVMVQLIESTTTLHRGYCSSIVWD